MMELGPLVLHRLIRHVLDPDASSTYTLGRVGLATLALIDPALKPAEARAEQAAAYRALMSTGEPAADQH